MTQTLIEIPHLSCLVVLTQLGRHVEHYIIYERLLLPMPNQPQSDPGNEHANQYQICPSRQHEHHHY